MTQVNWERQIGHSVTSASGCHLATVNSAGLVASSSCRGPNDPLGAVGELRPDRPGRGLDPEPLATRSVDVGYG